MSIRHAYIDLSRLLGSTPRRTNNRNYDQASSSSVAERESPRLFGAVAFDVTVWHYARNGIAITQGRGRIVRPRHRYFVTRIVKNVSALCTGETGKKKYGEKERRSRAPSRIFYIEPPMSPRAHVNGRNESALVY